MRSGVIGVAVPSGPTAISLRDARRGVAEALVARLRSTTESAATTTRRPANFLSVDPLVDETGEPYSYTSGDPVNGIDPAGLGGGGTYCGRNGEPKCPGQTGPDTQTQAKSCPAGQKLIEGACDSVGTAPGDICPKPDAMVGCDSAQWNENNPFDRAPSWPMEVISGFAGVVFCGPGVEACIAGGLAITATNVGSDVESHCSAGTIGADAAFGVAGTSLGAISSAGAAALDSVPAWERFIYGITTNSPSVATGGTQAGLSSCC